MIKFEIPYPPTKRGKSAWNKRFGLNAYYAGKHWSVRKKDAEYLHTLALISMKKAHIPCKAFKRPVEIRFFWNDNLDIDNHASLGKAFVDAMKGTLMEDDNRQWFKKVSHEFWDGDSILVEIVPYKANKGEEVQHG